jgi:cytochrome c oxidase assembly protein subunit 15
VTTRSRDRNSAIAAWLLVVCALVFAMVVLGGVTRLTGSGLSITDWKPIMGVLPPLTEADWQSRFELYQQSPEFQKINAHMGVDDFKGIFWLEYLHRLLGRTMGIAFLLPFLYFLARGDIALRQSGKYWVMFVLGGLQGLLGWYMVKSGLADVPRVSQYRLTAHLSLAFVVFGYMLWVALSLLYPTPGGARHPWFRRTVALTGLVCVTVISGGFVAGLDAGLVFNTFPRMGTTWLPPGMLALEPAWRNLFDNHAMVQFDHRILALSTLAAVAAYWLLARNAGLPARAATAIHTLLGVVALQVSLGIATLLLRVPVALAAAHQGVAMLLFATALYLLHSLRSGTADAGSGKIPMGNAEAVGHDLQHERN